MEEAIATPVRIKTYRSFIVGVRFVILGHIVVLTALGLALLAHWRWSGSAVVAATEGLIGLWLIAHTRPLPHDDPRRD